MSGHTHNHLHHHHTNISEKTIKYLIVSLIINMFLSIVELVGGIIAGSVALIGDALHNTSDALSILIAIIAFKIGRKKANTQYTYGFRRAETIGGFVNLILLFIAGIYLFAEGIERLISPAQIDGNIIIWVSVFALIIDAVTAKLTHNDAAHNTNMRMVFLHNLADALGSVGVIVSGLFVIWFDVYRVDGIVALIIAIYMIYQAIISFPKIVKILMNAVPDGIDIATIQQELQTIKGVKDVHHIHVWNINEHDISLECHIVADDMSLLPEVTHSIHEKFGIKHCNIQIESRKNCHDCNL